MLPSSGCVLSTPLALLRKSRPQILWRTQLQDFISPSFRTQISVEIEFLPDQCHLTPNMAAKIAAILPSPVRALSTPFDVPDTISTTFNSTPASNSCSPTYGTMMIFEALAPLGSLGSLGTSSSYSTEYKPSLQHEPSTTAFFAIFPPIDLILLPQDVAKYTR